MPDLSKQELALNTYQRSKERALEHNRKERARIQQNTREELFRRKKLLKDLKDRSTKTKTMDMRPVYYIRHYYWYGGPKDHSYIDLGIKNKKIRSLEDVLAHRKSGAELVVDQNNVIVQGTAWLWDWEIANPDCYARRMQELYKDIYV